MPDCKFKVIVSSCDAFADTWEPFFRLYRENAEQLDADLLLITEKLDYTYPSLNVRCTKANRSQSQRLSWGACVRDAVEQANSEIVLYLQDDYFIEKPIDAVLIKDLADEMMERPEIQHIGLTHFGARGPFQPTEDGRLWRVAQRSKYRINMQAALWRSDCLRTYVREDENGWMCEIYGSRRSWRKKEEILTVNRDLPCPLVYTHTGIIKGRWHRAMPDLFHRHGIQVDFEQRGFYDPPPTLLRKWETFRTLLSAPGRLWTGLRGL